MIPRFCRACSESTSLFAADSDTEASWRGPLEPARGPGARMRADGGADVEAPVDVTRQLAGSGPEALKPPALAAAATGGECRGRHVGPTPRARGCKPYECRRKPCLPPALAAAARPTRWRARGLCHASRARGCGALCHRDSGGAARQPSAPPAACRGSAVQVAPSAGTVPLTRKPIVAALAQLPIAPPCP